MHKIYHLALMAVLLSTAWGCTAESQQDNREESGNETVALTLSLRSPFSPLSNPTESTIRSLRVIIFKENSNGYAINTPVVNAVYGGPADVINIKEIVPVGNLTLCLIANEMQPNDFSGITSYATLEAERWNYKDINTDYLTAPFPMFSIYKRVHINAQGTISYGGASGATTFEIARAVAKISLKLECHFADLADKGITLTKAGIRNATTQPYLLSKGYDGIPTDDDYYSLGDIDMIKDTHWEEIGNPATGFRTIAGQLLFYVPEHVVIGARRNYYSYIELAGHFNTRPSMKIVYRVPLGNGLGKTVGSNTYSPAYMAANTAIIDPSYFTITRNTHYNIELNIKNMGTVEGLEVRQMVKPWTNILVESDLTTPYLNVSVVATTVSKLAKQQLYFWTNQKDNVAIKAKGKLPNGSEFTVSSVFDGLLDTTNFSFNPSTGLGSIDIAPNASASTGKHLLYLTAGNLTREITVNVQP